MFELKPLSQQAIPDALKKAERYRFLNEPRQAESICRDILNVDAEGFGSCTNTYDCEAVCPEEISVDNITLMNRDYLKAIVRGE